MGFNTPVMRFVTKGKMRLIVIGAGIFAGAAIIGSATFYFGYQSGLAKTRVVAVENVKNLESGKSAAVDFGIFWEAWDLLKNGHLKGGETADQKMLYGAIQGLTNSLGDPHTVFFQPEDSKKFEEDVNGSFGGIGAEIGIKNNQLVVIAPLKGSPAEKAGLKAGDKILAINETGTQGLDVNEAVKKIRGEVGTSIKLTVLRDAWEAPKDIEIVRATIEIPTLEWSVIENKDVAAGSSSDGQALNEDIAHIKLFSFNQNAPVVFYKAALRALLGRTDGLILDLRNNPGGYLEIAINLAGWFLDKGDIVVSEKFRDGRQEVFRADGTGALKDIPTVILVNEGSASASEILAGALHAKRNIKLIGTPTFGKGTVQELRSLGDNSKIKLTIANWVLPDGTVISEDGLKPDNEVKITETDTQEGKDPQLEKAIEVLRAEIAEKK